MFLRVSNHVTPLHLRQADVEKDLKGVDSEQVSHGPPLLLNTLPHAIVYSTKGG
jgi:hypothetical protein